MMWVMTERYADGQATEAELVTAHANAVAGGDEQEDEEDDQWPVVQSGELYLHEESRRTCRQQARFIEASRAPQLPSVVWCRAGHCPSPA
jgi:hypothetical protein